MPSITVDQVVDVDDAADQPVGCLRRKRPRIKTATTSQKVVRFTYSSVCTVHHRPRKGGSQLSSHFFYIVWGQSMLFDTIFFMHKSMIGPLFMESLIVGHFSVFYSKRPGPSLGRS